MVIGGTRGWIQTNQVGAVTNFVADQNGEYLQPPFKYCTAVDRNHDGYIHTSKGLTNVLNWDSIRTHTNDLGGVSTADDECIINYTRTAGTGMRTVAIDANNNLWVGGRINSMFEQIDGVTGQPVPNTIFQGCAAYGGLIDGNGVLWSSAYGNAFFRFDIKRRFDMTVNPPTVIDLNYLGETMPAACYGIGIDPKTGFIWYNNRDQGTVGRLNPNDLSITNFDPGVGGLKGLAVDDNGDVWVGNDSSSKVAHLRNDGSFVGLVDLGCDNDNPYGISIDSNGKVWAACNSGAAVRIDPNSGPRMLNDVLDPAGYILGQVDLTVKLDGPGQAYSNPYNYSDMTGFVSLGATEPSGIWRVVHDSGIPHETWGVVQWSNSIPAGTGIKIEVRAADDYLKLSATNNLFFQVTNGVPFNNMTGQFMEIRATLFHKLGTNATPVLYDLTVSSGTNAVVANTANFANSDRAVMFENGGPRVINVLSNDVVPSGAQLTITKVSPAGSGYVIIGAGATNLIYTPNTNFFGVDRFSYTASDGRGGIGRAVVTVEVGQAFPPPPTNAAPPIAQNTNVIVFGNSIEYPINVLAICYDTNNPPLTDSNIYIHSVTQAGHGYVRVSSCNLYYTPRFGYFGPDSFTYTIRDSVGLTASARVNITVTGQPPIPISCEANINGVMTTNNSTVSLYYNTIIANTYTFAGDPNQAITIDFTGDDYLYMQVYDPDGQPVYNMPIIAPDTNTYTIEVTTGSYDLQYYSNYNLSMSCSGASVPHMAVWLGTNGVVVPDGGGIDFGVTQVGWPVAASLTITNYGNASLTVNRVGSSIASGNFTVTNTSLINNAITIGPHGSSNLTVRFEAVQPGPTNGVLWLYCNDNLVNPYEINLTGVANATNTVPPTVYLSSPSSNVICTVFDTSNCGGKPIHIVAHATTTVPGVTIWGVNFYARTTNGNNILIGQQTYPSDGNGNYTIDWWNMPPGSYQLTAVAFDDFGLQAVSAPVSVTVLPRFATSPQMQLLFGTNNVPTGSTVYFGVVQLNTPYQVTLTITNLGPGTLTNQLNNPYQPFYFTNTTLGQFTLAPHTSRNVTLAFYAAYSGEQSVELDIPNNDLGLGSPPYGNCQLMGTFKLYLRGAATNFSASPSVVLTNPASNAWFVVNNNISLQASVTINDGQPISYVNFYAASTNGNQYLGRTYTPSGNVYSFVWTDAPVGAYALTAVVVDNIGRTVVSAPVPITVLLRPPTSPVMQVWFAQTNLLPNYVTIDYGVTLVGSLVTNTLVVSNIGNASLVLSNYSFGGGFSLAGPVFPATIPVNGWTNLAIRFTASATGNYTGALVLTNGDVASNPFVITNFARVIPAGTPPRVAITNPLPNAVFISANTPYWGDYSDPSFYYGTPISITATSAPAANIQEVDFYATIGGNTYFLGQGSDYYSDGTFTLEEWFDDYEYSVPPGNYALTAVAVDNAGLQKVSAPVPITVLLRGANSPNMQVLFSTNNVNVVNNSTLDFGTIPVNATSSVTLTITNLGPGILTNSSIYCSGGAFSMTTDSPSDGFILPQHASTNVTLVFAETYRSSFSGELNISGNDPGTYILVTNGQSVYPGWGVFTLNLSAATTNLGGSPTVTLTTPASNTVLIAGFPNSLVAVAIANDGQGISYVDFYAASSAGNMYINRGSNLGNNTYSTTWQNAAPGQYNLTAVAFDNLGRGSVSAAIPVTVVLRPTNSPVMQVFLSQTNPVPNYSTINYGITSVGTPAAASLTISNAGNAVLSISTLILSDTNDFSISNSLELPCFISAGASTNLTLLYNAVNQGQATGLLTIYDNDVASHPFYITNSGSANPLNGTPPTAYLTAPQDGLQVAFPSDITVTALARCATNSTLWGINFFYTSLSGNVQIGQVLAAPGQTNLIGTITWSRPAPGTYSLKAVAIDRSNLMGQSTNSVNVTVKGVPVNPTNLPPVANDDIIRIVGCVSNCPTYPIYVLANDTDPNNDPLTLVNFQYTGLLGTVVKDGNRLLFTLHPSIEGTNWVAYTITDGMGGYASAQVQIIVKMAQLPQIELLAPTNGADITLPTEVTNRYLPLIAWAASLNTNVSIAQVRFYDSFRDNDPQMLGYLTTTNIATNTYAFLWQTPPSGWHRITAYALDSVGQENLSGAYINGQQITSYGAVIYIEGKTNNTPPIAAITNLTAVYTNGTWVYPIVTNGIINVLGRARDVDIGDNVSYQLLLQKPDGTTVANITPGADSIDYYRPGTDNNGILATNVDLSLYENGVYDVVLNVFDDWEISSDVARILLNTQLKIGNFSFSVQDVVLPVSGIPITVTRTYNSLNRNNGEFGYSWTYAINDLNLQLDEDRQNTPDIDDNTFSLRVGGGRDVTLTLPDGRTVTFQFYFDGPRGPGGDYYAAWQSPPGVNYTLTAMGDPYYDSLTGFWNREAGTGFNSFDFSGFYLTAQDGTRYVITRAGGDEYFYASGNDGDYSDNDFYVVTYGAATLTEIDEPNGDTIRLGGDRIDHYDPTGVLTRSIRFQRDGQNRITAISDPNSSNGLPVMTYEYDPTNGNLIEADKLRDQVSGVYDSTFYQYTNTHFPHFMTGIIDPSGVQLAKNFYDDSGRLIAVQDADGKLTKFINNSTNNTEIVIDRLGRTNSYVYDLRGNVILETNALNGVTSNTYDASNHLTSTTDPLTNTTKYVYDSSGNQTMVIDPLNHTNFFSYDSAGRLTGRTDPLGNVTTNYYDGAGNLTNTIQLDAQHIVLSQSSSVYQNGQLVQTLNANNQITASFGYDGSGNLTSSTDANNFNRYFGYDSNGNQTKSWYVWTPPGGGTPVGVTNYAIYDSQNRAVQTIDADGNSTRTFYNALGKVDYTIDKFGNTNSFLYDARGNVIQTIYPNGTLTRTVYDDDGKPILTTDPNQITGTYTMYDALGRATNTIRYANVQVNLASDTISTGQVTTVIGSLGTPLSTNSTTYFANGWVQSRTGADGQTTTYDYWPDGQTMHAMDALNHTNYYAYDAAGHQTNMVDALNHSFKSRYDALGRLIATIFPDNTYTTNTFNNLGQRTGVKDQAGLLTQFGYNISGQLTNVIKPQVLDTNGSLVYPTWSYPYDQYGRQTATIDPYRRATTNYYDAQGRQLVVQLPMGQLATNVYATDATANHIKGQLVQQYDYKGQRAEFVYDKFGRIRAKFLFQAGAVVPYEAVCCIYNQLGQLSEIVERYGADATTNACDGYAALVGFPRDNSGIGVKLMASLNRNPNVSGGATVLLLLALSLALIPQEKRRRFALCVAEAWRANVMLGSALALACCGRRPRRTPRLRMPSLGWRLATPVVLAALLASEPGFDQLWTAHADCVYPSNASTPNTRITNFTYDLEGNLSQANTPEGVINYGYDWATGRLTSTCTTNWYVAYGYDALGRLQTVTISKRNSAGITPETTTYGYDAVGNRNSVLLPNGVLATNVYDNLNRLTNMVYKLGTTNLSSYAYMVDATGRRTNAMEILRQEDGTYLTNKLVWQFDQMHRLTNEVSVSASPAVGTYAYTNAYVYDQAGNRARKVRTGSAAETITCQYNGNDQLTNEVSSLGTTNVYQYDANGSLTNKTGGGTANSYTYDVANKLVGVYSGGTLVASYLYNDQGIRVSQTVNGGNTTHYLIDANNQTGYAQVLEEMLETSVTPNMSYVIGGEVLAQCGTTATAPSYFLQDGHGNNRQLMQLSGSVADHYCYDAYGAVQASTSTSTAEYAAADNTKITSKLFCGEQYDSNLHMYNLRARYYDPANGRFNQRDAFVGHNEDPQTLHKYLYCGADPVNGIDPSGNDTLVELLCVIGIGLMISAIHVLPIVAMSLYVGSAPDAVGFGVFGEADVRSGCFKGIGGFGGFEVDLCPLSGQWCIEAFGGPGVEVDPTGLLTSVPSDSYMIADNFKRFFKGDAGVYECWYWNMPNLNGSSRGYGWLGFGVGGIIAGTITPLHPNGTVGWLWGAALSGGVAAFGAVEWDHTFGPWSMSKGAMIGAASAGEGALSSAELFRNSYMPNSGYGALAKLTSAIVNAGMAATWVNIRYGQGNYIRP